jgi:hypothetical protein
MRAAHMPNKARQGRLPSGCVSSAGNESTPTLLAFLTTTCTPCRPFWEMMAAAPPGPELGATLVVVTPSRSMEDERAARRLTPPGVDLHMRSETWFSYGVAQAGTFVLVRSLAGSPAWEQPGEVLGSATPESPAALEALVRRWLARVPGPS